MWFRHTTPVDVVSPALRESAYSDELVEDWTRTTTRRVEDALVYPGSAVDALIPGMPERIEDKMVGFFRYGDPIKRLDRVTVLDGPHAGTYRVVDRPAHWKNPWTGWEAGCVVALEVVEGG